MNIALAGCGNMGFAMLTKWTTGRLGQAFFVVEPNEELRRRAALTGAQVYADASEIPEGTVLDVVVIATKPQYVTESVRAYKKNVRDGGLFVSVAAGISISNMQKEASEGVAIIRCMPNTPAAIGEGMIVCCPTQSCTDEQKSLTAALMASIGKVEFISDESWMDAVTAVSGSGPAYLFHFIEALSLAAQDAGLPPELASTLARQTAYGAARLAMESDSTPTQLREQVTSPNGTTAAALNVLMSQENGFRPLLLSAVRAAKTRSEELGKAG